MNMHEYPKITRYVRQSVWSVGQSVMFSFFGVYERFLHSCLFLKVCLAFLITAPAHSHATPVPVYPTLMIVFTTVYPSASTLYYPLVD